MRHILLALCLLLPCFLAPACGQAQTTTVKQSTPEPLYLYLQSTSTGLGVSGLTPVAKYIIGTGATETTGTGTFVDAGNGNYSYVPSSAELATLGKMLYRFTGTGCYDYSRELRVNAKIEADLFTLFGTPVLASVSLDIAANLAAINGLSIPTVSQIAGGVLGATAASYNSAGTIGNKINAAGTASDPLTAALSGYTTTGTAGNTLLRLNAMTNSSNQFTAGAFSLFPFPSEYLSAGEVAKLTAASTAQQAGVAVTLPAGIGNFYAPVTDNGGGNLTASLVLTITKNGSNQPVLSWTADSLATSYKVLRSTNGTAYTVIATPAAGTLTYTDTAEPAGSIRYAILSLH